MSNRDVQTQSSSFTLADLRAGDQVTYDGRQWTVTDHTAYDHPAWPTAEWVLDGGGETRVLEYDTPHGHDRFRISRSIDPDDLSPSDIASLATNEEGLIEAELITAELPDRVTYQGTTFTMTERDARIEPRASLSRSLRDRQLFGVVGGVAEYLNLSPNLFRVFLLACPLLLKWVFPGPLFLWYLGGAPLLYGLAAYLLSDPMPGFQAGSDKKPFRYCVYENGEHVLVMAYFRGQGWTTYAGKEVPPSAFDLVSREAASDGESDSSLQPAFDQRSHTIGPSFVEDTGPTTDRSAIDLSLSDLRAGDLVDYDMSTWTVTRHVTAPMEGWPTAMWTLEQDNRLLFLEHDAEEEPPFRLFAPADLSAVTVEDTPFLKAVPNPFDAERGGLSATGLASLATPNYFVFGYLSEDVPEEAPVTVEYNGDEYALAEEDGRPPISEQMQSVRQTHRLARSHVNRSVLGVFGGLAEYLGINPSASLFTNILVRATGIAALMGVGLLSLPFGDILLYGPLSMGPFASITFYLVSIVGRTPFLLLFSATVLYFGLALFLPEASRPREEQLSHYWVYEHDNQFLALECLDTRDWHAYVGHDVAPHEFDNILPREST